MRAFMAAAAVLLLSSIPALAQSEATPAFDVTATAQPSSWQDRIAWHGYYQFEYTDQQSAHRTFDNHKITVWMGVKLNDRAYLSSEVEYEHAPKVENSAAVTGGSGKIKIDSATLRISPIDMTDVYMGVFYVPFGIEYYSYPGHKNKLVSRPKVMYKGKVIPGTWSDVGIGGAYVVNGAGEMDLYVVNGDGKNGGVSRDNSSGGNDSKSVGVRLMFNRFIDGINFGGSYISGKWDDLDLYKSDRLGLHLRADTDTVTGISWAPVLIAEYVTGKDEAASSLAGLDKEVSGYYVQVSSLIHPIVELAARYGQYDYDEKVTDNLRSETSIGIVGHVMDGIQLKAEYQWNTEKAKEVQDDAVMLQAVAFW
ncbi:MAG: hypothetical protein HY751_04170 [Nitrospinae bacterium]|nr:hypothetical protein [Nitrospinota bacterium]